MEQSWTEFARSCFPDYKDDCGAFGSLDEFIDYVLEEEQRSRDPYFDHDAKISQLVETFPDVPIALITQICENFQDADLDELADAVLAHHGQKTGKRRPGYARLNIANRVAQFRPAVKSFAEAAAIQQQAIARRPFEFDFGEVYDASLTDVEELRSIAHGLYEQRRLLYHRAAEAFARGQLTGRFTASYYSQEARSLEPTLSRIFAQIATINFGRNNPDLLKASLDLHGLTTAQACAVTSAFLKHHGCVPDGPSARPTVQCVVIVSGAGRHSVKGGRLKPAIEAQLRSFGCVFDVENGLFRIYRFVA